MKKKPVQKSNSDGDDSSYVGDSVNGQSEDENTPPSIPVNNVKMNIYDGIMQAIVLRCCTVHNRYTRLNCRYTRGGVICNQAICDMCLYSRQMTVSK